jgi:hypothetical protein
LLQPFVRRRDVLRQRELILTFGIKGNRSQKKEIKKKKKEKPKAAPATSQRGY